MRWAGRVVPASEGYRLEGRLLSCDGPPALGTCVQQGEGSRVFEKGGVMVSFSF